MKIKNILLTGDDGYNSIGTRILIDVLKNDFNLKIAGTLTQQSGVGGYISLKEGGAWGETTVDGVPALWVGGHPVDAMECAQAYFPEPFDLVISGINLGSNVSGSFITSGTMAAAMRALTVGVASRSMAISWHLPYEFVHKNHDATEDLGPYISYPGLVCRKVIDLIIKEDFFGVPMVNVNLPDSESRQVRMTKFLSDIKEFYSYPLDLNKEAKRFAYPAEFAKNVSRDPTFDTGAILSGFISITPCQADILDKAVYNKFAKNTFNNRRRNPHPF